MAKNLRDMRFRSKLIIAFFGPILFSLLSLGFYAYNVASTSILESTSIHGNGLTKRLNERLDNLICEAAMVSSYAIGDTELGEVLLKDYRKFPYPFYEQTQDIKVYQHFMSHIMNFHTNLDYFIFYPLNQPYAILYSKGGDKQFVDEKYYKDQDWYLKAINADGNWIYTGLDHADYLIGKPKVISISRLIKDLDTQKPLAVLSIMIDQKSLVGLLNQTEEEGEFSFLLLDENQEILAQSHSFPQGYGIELLAKQEGVVSLNNKRYLQIVNKSLKTGWMLFGFTDQAALLAKLSPIIRGLLIVITSTLLVAIFLSVIIARSLVKPLEHLKQSMTKVKQGKWEPVQMETRNDEVGQLAAHYNKMIEQLKVNVELLIEKERQKKDLEFKSLQAQINPHFIYNTLTAINWMSMMGNTHAVSDMIEALVYVLRFISKRKGDFITLREEQEFLDHYLTIMRIRYNNQFELYWHIDEEVYDDQIPIMVLQPVIENAIQHGLEKEEGRGKIWISGFREDNRLIIVVEDNGTGMQIHRQENKQNAVKFSSIGLSNVEERLRLIYKDEAIFSIHSRPNIGTTTTYKIPITKNPVNKAR